MKRPNLPQLLTLMTLASTILACAPAHAQKAATPSVRQGHDEGNAGDGVYVNGQLVMRDFLSNAELVLDNKGFLNKYPELVKLLKEVANVDPQLSLAIWSDLTRVRIFTTNAALPLLPKDQTGLDFEQVADVQIAIRDGDDLLISLAGLAQLPEKEYLFLHESFHGLIKGTGPLHHLKIRSLTKYFRANRGQYKKESLETVLSKTGINVYHAYEGMGGSSELPRGLDLTEMYRILVTGQGPTESRCALLTAIRQDALMNIWASHDLSGIESWLDYPECKRQTAFDEFARNYPGLAATWNGASEPFVYEVSVSSSRKYRDIDMGHCNDYGGPKMRDQIQKYVDLVKGARADMDRLTAIEIGKGDDKPLLLAQKIIGLRGLNPKSDGIWGRGIVNVADAEAKAKEAENKYNGNLQSCGKYFKFRNGVWTK